MTFRELYNYVEKHNIKWDSKICMRGYSEIYDTNVGIAEVCGISEGISEKDTGICVDRKGNVSPAVWLACSDYDFYPD